MSKKVRYEKESGLHDDFKRLLLSLPLQPIIGNDYSLLWPSEDSVWKSELVYVRGFYTAGDEEYVSMMSDWDGEGGMPLSKWLAKAARGEVLVCAKLCDKHGKPKRKLIK